MSLHVIRGTGAPTFAPTGTGQHYIDVPGRNVYISVGTASPADWLLNNGVGPAGPTGPAGPAGPAGSKWYNGTGVPSSGLGSSGDYYLNETNGDVYYKVSGSWGSPIMNLGGGSGTVTGTGTAGRVAIWSGSTSIADDSTLLWDNTSKVLSVGPNPPAPFPGTKFQAIGTRDGVMQNNIQNLSDGANASADYVATSDNGTQNSQYVDLGINGSGYDVVGWSINGANDAYLYASDGTLAIGTAGAKPLQFFTNGTTSTAEKMRITSAGTVGIGTTSPTAQLHILSPLSSTIANIIQGASGQTADLTQWKSPSNSVLSSMSAGGYLTLPGDPTTTNMAATKGYVDTGLGTKQATGNYITALTGEVTASGPGSVAATVANSAVIAKVLTGYSSTSGSITASDSLLSAIQKLGYDQHVPVTLGTANGLSLSTQTLSLQAADATHTGALTSTDWSTFNGKQTALVAADATHSGYITSTDWNTFNGKQAALVAADATHTGYLTSTDWSTFNGKEPAIAAGTTLQYWRGDKTWQTLDKSAVGLSNVDNTSDVNKPVSTATSTAISGKEPTISAGTTSQYYRGDKTWQDLDNKSTGAVGITIDGGGVAITTGIKGYISCPFSGTITSWTVVSDQVGAIVIDVWKVPYASALPTVTNTITDADKPTLSSAHHNHNLTPSSWTVAVTAGDIFGFKVDSASTVTRVTLTIGVKKS